MFIAVCVVCIACMLGAPIFIRWSSRRDRAMHMTYPRIYYVCGVVLCESLFAVALIMVGTLALESDLNRPSLPFPPVVIQILVIVLLFLMGIMITTSVIVGTISICASLKRTHEQSRGIGS